MKGIVMEIMKEKVVVLTNNGEFLEVPKPNDLVDIGQEISLRNPKVSAIHVYRRIASIAAAIILFITGSYGAYGYYNPYGYANVDINPSVEISYNLFNRVLKIEGLNDDGNLIISKLMNYKFQPLDRVISEVVDRAIEEEYIKVEEENLVLVTITEKGKEVEEDSIYKSLNNHIKEETGNVEVLVVEGDQETYSKAKADKISPGKLMLINKALAASKEEQIENISNKSVKEIMNIIKDNKGVDKVPPGQAKKDNEATPENSNNGNNGKGQDKGNNGKSQDKGKNDDKVKPNDDEPANDSSKKDQQDSNGNNGGGNDNQKEVENNDKQKDKGSNNGNGNSGKENGKSKEGIRGRHR